MEHSVPEQMFSTEDVPAQGISAVKTLAVASAQGQKIYTIDQNNITLALNNINLNSDIEMEIRNAVNAGKIATVHERPVAFAGTTTVSYILLDPETGAGAYKIGTGENGGHLNYEGMAHRALMYNSINTGIPLVENHLVSVMANSIASFVDCVIDFIVDNAALLAFLAIIIGLILLFPTIGLAGGAVVALLASAGASAISDDDVESCSNNDFCYERWEIEDDNCSQWRALGVRAVAACKTRAADRRTLCIRNGGVPDPNEPPEWNGFVDWPR